MKQTAVEWFIENLPIRFKNAILNECGEEIEKAKAMEKEQKGYTEEQAYEIWRAGQEYWKTSGSSITFEELIEKFKSEQYYNETYNK
jgi:hypothetical protein